VLNVVDDLDVCRVVGDRVGGDGAHGRSHAAAGVASGSLATRSSLTRLDSPVGLDGALLPEGEHRAAVSAEPASFRGRGGR
jgi:hypothetical protein